MILKKKLIVDPITNTTFERSDDILTIWTLFNKDIFTIKLDHNTFDTENQLSLSFDLSLTVRELEDSIDKLLSELPNNVKKYLNVNDFSKITDSIFLRLSMHNSGNDKFNYITYLINNYNNLTHE